MTIKHDDKLSINQAKIRFNCRRGMSELENILYPFFDKYFTALSINLQHDFSSLLSHEDTDLWDWLVTFQAEPPRLLQEIVSRVKNAA